MLVVPKQHPPVQPSHHGINRIHRPHPKPKVIMVPDPPDGGYGWVIVIVAFFIYTLSMITMANFGIFLVELVEQYQAPNAVIGWIGALQLACHGLVGK